MREIQLNKPARLIRFCKKCDTETERYATSGCAPCARRRVALWAIANPDGVKAHSKKWKQAHPDQVKEASAAYTLANKDRLKEVSRKWRLDNEERVKSNGLKWRTANPERVAATNKAWQTENVLVRRTTTHNWEAKRDGVPGRLSRNLVETLLLSQGGMCVCCNQPLGNNYEIDHILPLALGGHNVDANIQLLRTTCNKQKAYSHPDAFKLRRELESLTAQGAGRA